MPLRSTRFVFDRVAVAEAFNLFTDIMSAARCLRCSLDAVRPAKVCCCEIIDVHANDSQRINLQSRQLFQSRFYADASGSTTPQRPGIDIKTTSSRAGPVKQETEQRRDAPPKRTLPTSAEPTAQGIANASAASPASENDKTTPESVVKEKPIPPNVAAAFRTPFRHDFIDGIPVASLQLRSYSVRNLEFFADFAMRVAYYLKLPASGPTPLPKKIERWTMPRSNFVHKKSQENFERITLRRLITVFDGHPDVVEVWLACLRKWQFYGVGMKANVWQFEGLGTCHTIFKFGSVLTNGVQMFPRRWTSRPRILRRNWMPSLPILDGTRVPLTKSRLKRC